MKAPLLHNLIPITPRTRAIDNHYHLQVVADNSAQLLDYQKVSTKIQFEAAATNLQALGELSRQQGQAAEALEVISASIDHVNHTLGQIESALERQADILVAGFEALSAQLFKQQQALEEIAERLSKPYEQQVQELLSDAGAFLQRGMKSMGRDRKENYEDAARLLGEVLKNPKGRGNYSAWFHAGWLLWKEWKDLAKAEEHFYQAGRLSVDACDEFHVLSLRHQAHMAYLQGKLPEAYESAQRALEVSTDYEVLFELARYSARTGRQQEAVECLDRCIELRPATVVTMFSEQDFLA